MADEGYAEPHLNSKGNRRGLHGLGGRKANINEGELRAAYESGMTALQCAVKFGVEQTTIYSRLRKIGISIRKSGWHCGRKKKLIDRDTLHKLYIEETRSIHEVAALLATSDATISKRLKEAGIQARASNTPRAGSPMLEGAPSPRKNKKGYMKAWVEKNRARVRERSREYREENKEKISAWEKEYRADYYKKNKKEIAMAEHKRYAKNREHRIAQSAESKRRRHKADPEAFKAKNAEYVRNMRARNIELARAKQRAYQTRRRKENIKVALRNLMASMVRSALRRSGNGKGGRSWKQMVPYTVDELRIHLQTTIPNGYTWDDFLNGELHIDHKIPQSVFNYSHPDDWDFKRCWALENLQLLPDKVNKKKGAKLDNPFQPTLF